MLIFIEVIILGIIFYKFRGNRSVNGWIVFILLFTNLLLGKFNLSSTGVNIFLPLFLLNYIGLYRKDKALSKTKATNPKPNGVDVN